MVHKLAIFLGCVGALLIVIGIALSFKGKEGSWESDSENPDIKD